MVGRLVGLAESLSWNEWLMTVLCDLLSSNRLDCFFFPAFRVVSMGAAFSLERCKLGTEYHHFHHIVFFKIRLAQIYGMIK